MLVQDFLYQSAARLPDKVALVHGKQRYTYRDLDAATGLLKCLPQSHQLSVHNPCVESQEH
ncbi:MAG: hypothetical protein C4530_24510 [Desulfobacteraceae bacterium]|nr:MAG: hypothetical protein C4530_24510 [Desulfobacteraceae bacterium]